MRSTCRQCACTFAIDDADLAFYAKISPKYQGRTFAVPPPVDCPACRRQRRLTFRNERRLYNGRCDLCRRETLSIYAPGHPFPVYCRECWWSDRYDPFAAGRAYDFSRPFTEQFRQLQNAVPHMALSVVGCENSEYVNQCGYSKNCYLSFNTDYSQDCYYCANVIRSSDCVDLLNAEACEFSFQSVDVTNCYMAVGCRNCRDCRDVFFCNDCIGCSDCFGCTNLRNAQYCFFNQQLTREQYRERMARIALHRRSIYGQGNDRARQVWLSQPFRATLQANCENVRGDNLRNCHNALDCYDCFNNRDTRYCTVTNDLKDSYDCDVGGYWSELCYENVGGGDQNYHCLFSPNLWGHCADVLYSSISRGGKDLFGCFGVRDRQYCILNRQYAREEYEALLPRIIEHMVSTGEWGRFLDPSLSPFGYNESVASEQYPLSREQALQQGFNWCDHVAPPPAVERVVAATSLPDSSLETPPDLLSWALECEVTKKPYRVIRQEFRFYQEHRLPIPQRHPDRRHLERVALRNPPRLYRRSCGHCATPLDTSFPPDRPETVYCESCYLQNVY